MEKETFALPVKRFFNKDYHVLFFYRRRVFHNAPEKCDNLKYVKKENDNTDQTIESGSF